MAMKNMSFGKLLGIFAGFLLAILIGAVVVMKASQKKGGTSVVTKTYTPAETQAPPANPAAPQPAGPLPLPAAPQPTAPDQQTAQAATQAALPSQQGVATTAGSNPPAQASSGNGAQALYPEPAQQNTAQRLASIERQLASIQSRLTAAENKRGSTVAVTSRNSTATPTHAAKRVRRAQPSSKVASASEQADESSRVSPQPSEVKALAVVGNRAWVRSADGTEDSVTAGDALPTPRPRVRSVDASSGVVIMSSVAD